VIEVDNETDKQHHPPRLRHPGDRRHRARDLDRRLRRIEQELHFRPTGGAHASCVIDDYLSRIGSHPYREIACILAGPGFTNVFVGASLVAEWPRLGPLLQRAAGAVIER
jgi:hypothetical protein